MILGARIGILAKFAKFSNRDISKNINSFNEKFKKQVWDRKRASWMVRRYKITIQDGGGRHL